MGKAVSDFIKVTFEGGLVGYINLDFIIKIEKYVNESYQQNETRLYIGDPANDSQVYCTVEEEPDEIFQTSLKK